MKALFYRADQFILLQKQKKNPSWQKRHITLLGAVTVVCYSETEFQTLFAKISKQKQIQEIVLARGVKKTKSFAIINICHHFLVITGCISVFVLQRDCSDPEESFRQWLQRKHEQQQKEKQLEELKRLEVDSGYLLRSREECEHAFKV